VSERAYRKSLNVSKECLIGENGLSEVSLSGGEGRKAFFTGYMWVKAPKERTTSAKRYANDEKKGTVDAKFRVKRKKT